MRGCGRQNPSPFGVLTQSLNHVTVEASQCTVEPFVPLQCSTALRKPGTEDSGPSFSGTYAMAHQTPTVVIRGAICLPYGTSGPAICKPLQAPFLLPWAADRSCARGRRRRRLRSPDTVAPAGPLFRALLHGTVPPGARLRSGERNIRTLRSTKD